MNQFTDEPLGEIINEIVSHITTLYALLIERGLATPEEIESALVQVRARTDQELMEARDKQERE